MSYLVPFYSALQPHDQILYRAIILNDEPGIPDDTYQLQEWFCPNPECSCNEVNFQILADRQKRWVMDIRLALDPLLPPAPIPKFTHQSPPFARQLFKVFAEELIRDPSYIQRLREHYHTVKFVAADPTHPCHATLAHWAETGKSPHASTTHQKRRRKKR